MQNSGIFPEHHRREGKEIAGSVVENESSTKWLRYSASENGTASGAWRTSIPGPFEMHWIFKYLPSFVPRTREPAPAIASFRFGSLPASRLSAFHNSDSSSSPRGGAVYGPADDLSPLRFPFGAETEVCILHTSYFELISTLHFVDGCNQEN